MSRPLRVLHVVSHFPPDRIGGVGQVAQHVHRGLLDRGVDSQVLTTGSTNSDPLVRRVGTSLSGFALTSVRARSWAATFDVIHAHHGEAWGLLELMARRVNGPSTLLTLHVDNRKIAKSNLPAQVGTQRVGGWNGQLALTLMRAMGKQLLDVRGAKLADRVSFISRAGACEVLGAAGYEAPVIYNGVPIDATEPHHPAADETHIGEVDLLYVGTAGQRKRTDLLPAILARVHTHFPHASMRIVGFEPDNSLTALCDRYGVRDSMEFIGPLLSGSLAPYYRSAKVLVCPSAYEGLPMVLMEALSHGLPVVATDVGGTSELVADAVTGYVVAPDDVGAMAARVGQALQDQTWRLAAGAKGQEVIASSYTIPDQVDRYKALYDELASGQADQQLGSWPNVPIKRYGRSSER